MKLPGGIDAYFQFINDILANSLIVKSQDIFAEKRTLGAIIFRYDDAPHFPSLPNAPHHKHVGETDVVSSESPDLQSVLKEIETIIA